jgi:peroxiredoxin
MAATASTMLPLGTEIPAFSLRDAVAGDLVSPAGVRGEHGLLVMFICSHCPFVHHVLAELTRLTAEYQPSGIGVIAINSNDVEAYPQDGPGKMKQLAEEQGWRFPFAFDETQEVAKTFRAACTPDFYLFDEDLRLVYRGQLDDSRPNSEVPVSGGDLRSALDALLAGKAVSSDQKPSLGCNIKWAKGREPEYFGM